MFFTTSMMKKMSGSWKTILSFCDGIRGGGPDICFQRGTVVQSPQANELREILLGTVPAYVLPSVFKGSVLAVSVGMFNLPVLNTDSAYGNCCPNN